MLNTTAGRKKAPEPWPIAAVADAVVTTDDSWVIRSWNRPMEELFGWAEGTVVGRDLYEVLGLDQRLDPPARPAPGPAEPRPLGGRGRRHAPRRRPPSRCSSRCASSAAPRTHRPASSPWPVPARRPTESIVRVDDDENHSEPGLPGLFVLHYQPEVDLEHYSVVSCEALLRWHHPGLGLLSPGGFLGEPDLAARLEALGAWTFFAACRQAALWTADHDMRVTVNISGQQLVDRELAGRVRLAMTAAGVEPGRFGVEITADQLGSDPDHHPPGPGRAGRDRRARACSTTSAASRPPRAGPTCRWPASSSAAR